MSQRRSALGRGLGALISNPARPPASEARGETTQNGVDPQPSTQKRVSTRAEDRDATAARGVQDARPAAGPANELDVALIDPNPEQPRREFDRKALEQLAQSIGEHGVLQPVVVRRAGERFELIMGERRFRASQLAGRRSIPAVISEVDTSDRLELAIIENVQRQDLNPIELALAYKALGDAGHTQEEIGNKVSMDRSSISNHVRLLELTRSIQGDLEAGKLSMGHAKALLQVDGNDARESLRDRIAREGLSVRATEKLAREISGGGSPRKKKGPDADSAPNLDADTRAFVERIERRLQTKVRLHPSSDGSGKLEIQYFNLEDLERLGGMLLGEGGA